MEWRRNWKALTGLTLGGITLAGLSLALMPEASIDYIRFSVTYLPTLLNQKGFPIWHAHTPRAFFQLLLPGQPTLIDGLYGLSLIAGFAAFGIFWRRFRSQPALLFSAAICLTIWATPHAMIYDWAILLLPAVLLWQNTSGDWKGVFALVWIASFLSGPLTIGQLKLLPFAVQISVPVLAVAVVWIYRSLSRQGDSTLKHEPG
jgi:hypothetical protein